MTGKKEMGWERNISIMYTSVQEKQDIYCYFENGN